jgi:hypothetical protein
LVAVSGANGASDGPNFQRVDPAPREAGLSPESGLDLLRRRREANNAAPEPARREPAPPPPSREPPQAEAHEAEPDEHGAAGEGEGGGEGGEAYELVIDGERRRVSLPELMQGYLRQSDYSRKTQEVSQEQQKANEVYRQFQQATQELEGKLARYVTEVGQEFSQPIDWVKLAREDPMGYPEKRARFDMLKEAH